MIVIRAPLRVSFGGGGTDLPAFYEEHGGFVLSAAITRYCYALIEESADGSGSVTSADYGARFSWRPRRLPAIQAPLALPKAALREVAQRGALTRGVTIALSADVPPGSGLGSSSAMAVATLQALSTVYETPLTASEAASRACALEIDRLGMPIGKQDQYASAYGGVNTITFTRAGVEVAPLRLSVDMRRTLAQRLQLFWTGRSHDSAGILRGQRRDTQTRADVVELLRRIKATAYDMRDALQAGDVDSFGQLLDCAWQTKRQLSTAISSSAIDDWYAAAKDAGAIGGKITGAGGGGFLLLYTPPERQRAVRETMSRCGLSETPVAFDTCGVARLSEAPSDWSQRFDAPRAGEAPSPMQCSA